jgi:putative phosphoesterase
MRQILLLSDTHGYLDERLRTHLEGADEIWHAGDFGSVEVVRRLEAYGKVLRGVHGNIDGADIRRQFPRQLQFDCEGIRVAMTHIAGRPGRYQPDARALLASPPPDLLLAGHSHILTVQRDRAHGNLLFVNPGAAGKEGFHKMQTAIRFVIDGPQVRNMAVIEIGRRGAISPGDPATITD